MSNVVRLRNEETPNPYGHRELHHDFETYCEVSIFDGAFQYAQHPSCDVLLLSWGFDEHNIETWEPHRDPIIPQSLVDLALDPEVEFHAHNAQFEYAVWKYVMVPKYGAPPIDASRYVCTAVQCAAAGLPRALDKAGMVLNLATQKDKDGSRLIKLFCGLQAYKKPTKAVPAGVPVHRVYPRDRPEDWKKFVSYNRDDVGSELGIPKLVPRLSLSEQMFYTYDLEMNDRGLPLDMEAVTLSMPVLTELENRTIRKVVKLTGGVKPTQRDRMMDVFAEMGLDLENLQAKTLKDILTIRGDEIDVDLKQLLMLRLEGGKASTKKLKKMLKVACADGRVRGGFLFYGAHTGRWSGKLIQPQNFTRGEYSVDQMERLFWLLMNTDADVIEMLYAWPIDAIAQGMRGFIKPSPGNKFVVCDFSAIEARMLAWLADETEVLKIYHANGDVYVRMAASLYRREESELLKAYKGGEVEATKQRKFGKDIVLGCGFQMGGPGFYRNCISRGINVEEDFCIKAVKVYRKDHPKIVRFWYDVEACAILAVDEQRSAAKPVVLRDLSFFMSGRWLCIKLPSGRRLRYIDPKVQNVERFGKVRPQLSFKTEVKGKWIRETTYGGKLVENITQAVARDVMAESMVRAARKGYPCVGTVHDELITEVADDFGSAKELREIMLVRPKWCKDAPINAEGWQGARYRK